jgi:hypothetical protein
MRGVSIVKLKRTRAWKARRQGAPFYRVGLARLEVFDGMGLLGQACPRPD